MPRRIVGVEEKEQVCTCCLLLISTCDSQLVQAMSSTVYIYTYIMTVNLLCCECRCMCFEKGGKG
jgi:hypothetical protein